jgi:hypothetical protein
MRSFFLQTWFGGNGFRNKDYVPEKRKVCDGSAEDNERKRVILD